MSTFKYIEPGDILSATEVAICHQVNCRGVMGSGLAKQISEKWPYVKKQYVDFCSRVDKKEELLGMVQAVNINGADLLHGGQYILNVFGQLDYGRDGKCYTDYHALARAFVRIDSSFAGMSVAFPFKFGCGLAGGDWYTVLNLMDSFLSNVNEVVIYQRSCDRWDRYK